jgi:hypothetical protein
LRIRFQPYNFPHRLALLLQRCLWWLDATICAIRVGARKKATVKISPKMRLVQSIAPTRATRSQCTQKQCQPMTELEVIIDRESHFSSSDVVRTAKLSPARYRTLSLFKSRRRKRSKPPASFLMNRTRSLPVATAAPATSRPLHYAVGPIMIGSTRRSAYLAVSGAR